MKRLLTALALMSLITVPLMAVTQTGNLIVAVSSEGGQSLPGVNVQISSDILMGVRNQFTNAKGMAMFRNLPPGKYTATASLDGFQTTKQDGIAVRIQKTRKVDISMQLGETEVIVNVVDTSPLVDTSTNTVAVEFDFDNYINHMPTGRHYTNLAGLAGGTRAGNNASVLGGGSRNNLYLVDGVSTNDPLAQTWGTQINMDTIQDVSFQMAGISAEYGSMMGGVMNIVTKSGSNEIHGSVRLHMQRWKWNDESENNPDLDYDNATYGSDYDNWYLSGGGPLLPDTVWWYAGYSTLNYFSSRTRRTNPFNENELTPYERPYAGHFFNIKGTAQIGENIKATLLYKEDPINIPNLAGGRTQVEAEYIQTQGGDSVLATASWVMSEDTFIEGRWARDRASLDQRPQTKDDSDAVLVDSQITGPHYDSVDGWQWGATLAGYYSERNADLYAGSFNWLLSTDSLGEHDIKIGVDYYDAWNATEVTYYPSNEYIYTSSPVGIGFDNVQWLSKTTWENRLPRAAVHTYTTSIYFQDSAQITDAFTLNIGVRSDLITLDNNQETELISSQLLDTLAPRVGFAYDLGGHSIHGSFGRYYDTYWQTIADQFNVFPVQEVERRYEPTDGIDGRNGWTLANTILHGQQVSPHSIDDSIAPQYMDEFTLGADFLLTESIAFGINGVWRIYRDLNVGLDYDANFTYNYVNIETDAYGSKYKEYMALIFDLRKRPTDDNLFLQANLTLNSLEGFGTSSYLYDWGAPWDDPSNAEEWYGDRGDATIDFKMQATYFFPNNWYFGTTFTYRNGYKYTSWNYAYWPGYGWYYPEPNGRADMERTPGVYDIDIQFGIEQEVEFPFDIPFTDNGILLAIYANIYNLTNNQIDTSVRNYMGAWNYGKPTSWKSARSYLLGFRIEL